MEVEGASRRLFYHFSISFVEESVAPSFTEGEEILTKLSADVMVSYETLDTSHGF